MPACPRCPSKNTASLLNLRGASVTGVYVMNMRCKDCGAQAQTAREWSRAVKAGNMTMDMVNEVKCSTHFSEARLPRR